MFITTSCSTIDQFIGKKDSSDQIDLRIKASPSQNPNDELKILGVIEIEVALPSQLPYRAVNYRIQLLNDTQTQVLSETHTNSIGEFFFMVEKEPHYYLKIISNQNIALKKIHGPFSARDALTIKIPPQTFTKLK